jgi:hypothetical protein
MSPGTRSRSAGAAPAAHIDHDLARLRFDQTRDCIQQLRLARSSRTDDSRATARADFESHIAQGRLFAILYGDIPHCYIAAQFTIQCAGWQRRWCIQHLMDTSERSRCLRDDVAHEANHDNRENQNREVVEKCAEITE